MSELDIPLDGDPSDWEWVIWTGAVEVHASYRAVATLLRAKDKHAACACGGELPPTIMGRPLMIDPQLPGYCLEIVYARGDRQRFEIVNLK